MRMPRVRRRRRHSRLTRRTYAILGVIAAFVVALIVWIEGGAHDTPLQSTGHPEAGARPGSGGPTDAAQSAGGASKPGGTRTTTIAGPALPAFSLETRISIQPPGPETVFFRATSDATIYAVGYQVEGQSANLQRSVASPLVVSIRAPAGKRAVMAVEAGPTARSATCSISIDGGPPVTNTTNGPGTVAVCVTS